MYEETTGEEKPHKAKEVLEQLDKLGKLLTELDADSHSLEEKLKPILHELVEEGNQDEKPVPQLVPLANSLREQCNHAERVLFRIKYLCRELQI